VLYLLDAGVLITAHNLYYPVDSVPEFWSWLVHTASQGVAKVPAEIFDEVKEGRRGEEDLLYRWIQQEEIKEALVLDGEPDVELVRRVIDEGYAPDLTDDEVEQLGRDPFLVAYALVDRENRWVVTTEVSSPRKQRQNRKLPDVCETMGINWCDTFAFLRAQAFTTSWRRPP
jgi:hypothetical protein